MKFVNKEGKEVKNLELKEGEKVGNFCRRLIVKYGKSCSNEMISKMGKEKFSNSKVNYKHVAWYKGDMRKSDKKEWEEKNWG